MLPCSFDLAERCDQVFCSSSPHYFVVLLHLCIQDAGARNIHEQGLFCAPGAARCLAYQADLPDVSCSYILDHPECVERQLPASCFQTELIALLYCAELGHIHLAQPCPPAEQRTSKTDIGR